MSPRMRLVLETCYNNNCQKLEISSPYFLCTNRVTLPIWYFRATIEARSSFVYFQTARIAAPAVLLDHPHRICWYARDSLYYSQYPALQYACWWSQSGSHQGHSKNSVKRNRLLWYHQNSSWTLLVYIIVTFRAVLPTFQFFFSPSVSAVRGGAKLWD